MRTRTFMWVAGAMALFAVAAAAPARGETNDKRTVFSFNRPISVPGVTLPAGDYLFRIVDTETSRKVIQVLSGDGKTPYAMLHTIPDVRVESSGDPEVRFMETAKGKPSAVKAWWYPNERIGYEFIYPKEQARLLAEETHEPVLTTKTETTKVEETAAPDLVRVEPEGQEAPVVVAEAAPIEPAPFVEPEPRTELPVTGTSLPAFAIAGLLALAFAAGVRAWRTIRA